VQSKARSKETACNREASVEERGLLMCYFCGALESCDKVECGALPRYDENGKPRWHYLRWFYPEEKHLCEHALAKHHEKCAIKHFHDCSCEWPEDEDYLVCVHRGESWCPETDEHP